MTGPLICSGVHLPSLALFLPMPLLPTFSPRRGEVKQVTPLAVVRLTESPISARALSPPARAPLPTFHPCQLVPKLIAPGLSLGT